MVRKKHKDDGFKPCWDYYHCSEETIKQCPAYPKIFNCEQFSDCWFYITNPIYGRPAHHGPCAYCKWNQKNRFY